MAYELGNAVVSVSVDDREALKQAAASAKKIGETLAKGIQSSLNSSIRDVLKPFDKVDKALDKIAKERRKIRLEVDDSEVDKSFTALDKRIKDVGNKSKLELRLDTSEALADVKRLFKSVDDLAGKTTLELKLNTAAAIGSVEKLHDELMQLRRVSEGLDMKMDSSDADKDVARIRDDLKRIDRVADIDIKVNATDAINETRKLTKLLADAKKAADITLKVTNGNALTNAKALSKEFELLRDNANVRLFLQIEESIGQIERLRGEIEALRGQSFIRLRVDSREAQEDIRGLRNDMLSLRDAADVRLNVSADNALAIISALRIDIEKLSAQSDIQINVEAKEAVDAVERIEKAIQDIKSDSNVKLDLEADEALRTVLEIQRELSEIRQQNEFKLKLEADQVITTLNRIRESLGELKTQDEIRLGFNESAITDGAEKAIKGLEAVRKLADVRLKLDIKETKEALGKVKEHVKELKNTLALKLEFSASDAVTALNKVDSTIDKIANKLDYDLKLNATKALNDAELLLDKVESIKSNASVKFESDRRDLTDDVLKLQSLIKQIKESAVVKLTIDSKQAYQDSKQARDEVEAIKKNSGFTLEMESRDALSQVKSLGSKLEDVAKLANIKIDLDARSAIEEAEQLNRAVREVHNNKTIKLQFDNGDLLDQLKAVKGEFAALKKVAEVKMKLDSQEAITNAKLAQKEMESLRESANVKLQIQTDRFKSVLGFIREELDSVRKNSVAKLEIKTDKAKQKLKSTTEKVTKLKKEANVELRIKTDLAIAKMEDASKAADRLSRQLELELKADNEQALKNIEEATKQLKITREAANVELKLNNERLIVELKEATKQAERLAESLDLEMELNNKLAIENIKQAGKDLKELQSTAQLEIKVDNEQALAEIKQATKVAELLANNLKVKMELENEKALKEIDLAIAESKKLQDALNLQMKLENERVIVEIKEATKQAEFLQKSLDLQMKLDNDKAIAELKNVTAQAKNFQDATNTRLRIETDLAETQIKETTKQLKTLIDNANIKLKVDGELAEKEIDLTIAKLKAMQEYASLEMKLENDRTIAEIKSATTLAGKLQDSLDLRMQIDSKEAIEKLKVAKDELKIINDRAVTELKIRTESADKALDRVEKEAARLQKIFELELKINSDEATEKMRLAQRKYEADLNARIAREKMANEKDVEALKALTRQMEALQKSADIKMQLDAKAAENELRRVEKRFDDLGKRKVKVDVDFEIKDDEVTRIRKFVSEAGKLGDTIKIKTAEGNVSQARSSGSAKGIRDAERELAILKEMLRYKKELERVRKLGLDAGELGVIEDRLERIHKLSNRKIDLEFQAKGLDKVQKQTKNALSTVLDGALLNVGYSITNMLENAVRSVASTAVGIVGSGISKYADFGGKMNEFKAKSGSTDAQTKDVSDYALKLAANSTKTAKDAAEASAQLAILGFKAEETKGLLSGVLALSESTGLQDLGTAAKIAGVGMNVFGTEAGRTADLVATVVNNSAVDDASELLQVYSKAGSTFNAAGQSVETLMAMFGTLRDKGLQAGTAARALNSIFNRLLNPTGQVRDVLKQLNVEMDETGKVKDVKVAMAQIMESMKGFSQADQMKIAGKLAGTQFLSAFLALLEESGQGGKTGDLFTKLMGSDGAAKATADQLLSGFSGSLERMYSAIDVFLTRMGEAIAPALGALANAASAIFASFEQNNIFESLNAGAQQFADYLSQNQDVVNNIAQAFTVLATDVLSNIGGYISDFTEQLRENPDLIGEMVDKLVTFSENMAKVAEFAFNFAIGMGEALLFVSDIAAALGGVADIIPGVENGTANIAQFLGQASVAVIGLMALNGLISTVTSIAGGISSIVGFMGGWAGITAGIGSAFTVVKGVVLTIGGMLSGTVLLAIGAIAVTLYNIVYLVNNWSDFCLSVSYTLEEIDNTVKKVLGKSEILQGIWSIIKGYFGSLLNPVGTLVNHLKKATEHSEFFRGIWDGMEATFSSVGGWIQNYVINPIMAAKNALGGLLGMGGDSSGGGVGSGGSASEADKYVGAVLSVLEAPTRQGRIDVAQVVSNRVGTNFGGYGSSIRDQAFAPGQFQPFFKETYGIGKNDIQNRDSAIKALQKAGYSVSQATEAIDNFFADIADSAKVANSASKVGGRAYFKGVSEYGNMRSDDFLRNRGENFFHHEDGDQKNRKQTAISSLFGSSGATSGGIGAVEGLASGIVNGRDPSKAGKVIVNRTGQMDERGLEKLAVRIFDKQGNNRAMFNANSGIRSTQNNFGEPARTVAGTNNPMPFGDYNIGPTVAAPNIPGYGKMTTLLAPQFDTARAGIEAHVDGNRDFSPGSAGCLVFKTEAEFAAFMDAVRASGADTLRFEEASLNMAANISKYAGKPQANSKINALLNAERMDENDPEVTKQLEDDNKQKEIDQALQAARSRYDLNRKEDRSMRENNIKVAREKQVTDLKKQAVGVTDPTAKAQIDNRLKRLTEGGGITDEITKLEMDVEDLSVARARKQQDLKAGGDRAKRAQELPDFSKAIKNANVMIAQKKALRDATLGLNDAEYNYELSQKELQAARQNRDAKRDQDFAKQEDSLKRQLAIAKGTNEEAKVQKQLDKLGLQKGMSGDLSKLQDQRQDKQLQINKFKATLGKGEKSKELELMLKESQLLDQQIVEIKSKAQQEGVILDLKYRQEELEISRKRRDEERSRLFDNNTANLRDEIALMEVNGDNYARIKNIQLDRLEYEYKQSDELTKQQDILEDLQGKYDELKQAGGGDLGNLESDISAVKRNIDQIKEKTGKGLRIFDAKEMNEIRERARLLKEIKQSQQSALQESNFNRTEAEIGKIRKTDPYSSRANNMERDLMVAQAKANLQAEFAKLDAEAQDQIKQGANPAETLANLDRIKQNLHDIAQIDLTENLSKVPNILQQSADIVKQGLVSGISDIVFSAKSAQEALSDLLGNLAKQLMDMALNSLIGGFFSSLFGGGGGLVGGLLGGGGSPVGSVFSGVLGGGAVGMAATGGTVKNYASGTPGDALSAIRKISDSISNERMMSGGRNPQLAVVNAGELIIDAQTSDKLRGLTAKGVKNYAMGNVSLKVGDSSKSGLGGVTLGDVNVNINGNATEQDGTRIAKIVRAQIVDELLKQKKPGGLL